MDAWTKRLASLLTGSLLLPIGGEYVISLIKGEQFNLIRALISIVVIGGFALLVMLVKPRRVAARLAISVFLIAAGLGIAIFGFLLTAEPHLIEDGLTSDIVGAVTLCVGLLIFSIGAVLLGEHRRNPPVQAPPTLLDEAPERPGHLKLTKYPGYRAEAHDPVIELCRARLSVTDLHYVAYYVARICVFRMDYFDDPHLGRFHGVISPDQRRAMCDQQGKRLDRLTARLNDECRRLDTGILTRVVLDVERGAIYYFVVHQESSRYLIGITLDQDQVHTTDTRLAALVDDIRHLIGHPRVPGMER